MLSDVAEEVVTFGGQVRIIESCVAEELIVPLLFSRYALTS